MLAASPSFLQTTCEEVHSISGRLTPNLPTGRTYLPPYHPAKSLISSELGSWERKLRPQEVRRGAETWPLPTVKVMLEPQAGYS